MIVDIFSSFDYTQYTIIPIILFFLITPLSVFFLINILWTGINQTKSSVLTCLYVIFRQLIRTSRKHLKGISILVVAVFLTLVVVNLEGLIPYTFSVSTHLILTLRLGLPLWLSLIVSSIIYNPKSFVSHFLPDGAPLWLNPFLVLIETTRILVRPLTLSFRLAANIRAGHIVLRLVGTYIAGTLFSRVSRTLILAIVSTGYILFEVAICLIQAYIFCLLVSLYSDDHS
jgi:ATP synthase subunit 6